MSTTHEQPSMSVLEAKQVSSDLPTVLAPDPLSAELLARIDRYWRAANHVEQLEAWMQSYRPLELFDDDGPLMAELADLAPTGARRMGANPHANGGLLLRNLRLPDFHVHAVDVPAPSAVEGQDTLVLGSFCGRSSLSTSRSATFGWSVGMRRRRQAPGAAMADDG